jgi:hypothetical protein
MVKRYIRTVKEHLRKVVASHQRDWDAWLPFILLVYEASTHENRGLTPANLVFWRELLLPCNLLFGTPTDKERPKIDHDLNLVDQVHDIHSETANTWSQWPDENSVRRGLVGGRQTVDLSPNLHDAEVAQAPILMEEPIQGNRPDKWYGIQDLAEP